MLTGQILKNTCINPIKHQFISNKTDSYIIKDNNYRVFKDSVSAIPYYNLIPFKGKGKDIIQEIGCNDSEK